VAGVLGHYMRFGPKKPPESDREEPKPPSRA